MPSSDKFNTRFSYHNGEPYQGGPLLSVQLDEVVDEVEEVPGRDGHDAAAAFQGPLVGRVKRLVDVDLNKEKST